MSARTKKPKPRYWRTYRGCRHYDERTGSLKRGALLNDYCTCPALIYVGKKRAKQMARVMESTR